MCRVWNTLLAGLVTAGILPSTPPRERQTLHTNALGTEVWVDVMTYDPGLLGGAASAPLGHATTFILENANPLNPSAPSLITDNCGQSNSFSQSGMASGGAVHRSNPASPGTKNFGLNSSSPRDADQGPSAPAEPTTFPFPPCVTGTPSCPLPLPPGIPVGGLDGDGLVNNLDVCPFTPNFGSPLSPAGPPFSGDEEPGSPQFPDGIDSACDPNPTAFNGSDADGDGYANRGDNCPLVANGIPPLPNPTNQRDVGEFLSGTPVDGGPATDSIGDDCDLNPTVADGHFHSKLNLAPNCITGGPFSDGAGDGWCGAEEAALGSNPGSSASTPESLQVPGSCSDGADNDGDGSVDLADSGCQLPMHDLSIKKLTGGTQVCAPSNTVGYNVILNNSQTGNENGEVSFYLDSQPSYVPAPGPAPAPGKSAGSVTSVSGATVTASGPINIDGDADVEWLTKATVTLNGAPSFTTTVHFNVTYPACGGGPNATALDYVVSADLCHGNDIAPLGVSPLFGACAGTADGGQDRNNGNDGVVTRSVDDVSK